MKLADKTGVLNVLRNIYFDTKQKMQYIEMRRFDNTLKHTEVEQFPGYEEKMQEFQQEIRNQRFKYAKLEQQSKPEVIGERSAFFIGENSNVDMPEILKGYNKELIQNFTREQFEELMNKDEMIAFMSEIKAQKTKTES